MKARSKVDNKYTIKDLCERFGITPRTIYYYISIGLLPPAGGRGRGFKFSEEFAQKLQNVLQYRHKVKLSAIPLIQYNASEVPNAKKVMTIKLQSNSHDFLEYAFNAIESAANSLSSMTSSMLAEKSNEAMIVAFPMEDGQINTLNEKINSLRAYSQSYNGGIAFKAYTSIDTLQHAIVENINE
jgi:DNA-binding transcriptional MerR regulator